MPQKFSIQTYRYSLMILQIFSHPADSCGLNGLPLTPNSISILGNGQILRIANHPHLAKYLDVTRGKHQRIVVVSEFWKRNLRTALQSLDAPRSEESLLTIVRQILAALSYLNQMNIVNLNLRPETIMLDELDNVKLFAYGIGKMTDYGRLVAFPIGDPRLTAPEVFLRGTRKEAAALLETELERQQAGSNGDAAAQCNITDDPGPPDTPQADVWSLGMILAGILLNIPLFWPQAKIGQIVRYFQLLIFNS
jgi:TBC domain-containing protein kinase-like protein